MNGNSNNIKKLLDIIINIIKAVLLPYTIKAIRTGSAIQRSAEHDFKIAVLNMAIVVVMLIMSVVIWITLGLGLFIFAIYGTGDAFLGWFYVLIFEIITLLVLKLIIDRLKNKFILKRVIEDEFKN